MKQSGASVVGVSTDPPEKAELFRRELELPFPMVGDPTGAIVRAYRVRWPIVGWARRVTYVVGTDRRVMVAYHSELAADEHAARACGALVHGEPA
jgi:thioredoxin-dependent peroxiredoxin